MTRSYRHDDELTVQDWFCGAGGSSQGAHAVPGVRVDRAANHWERAIETHATNFPDVDHYQGDIRDADVHRWPMTDLFWASPECPQWSSARGKWQDFATSRQDALFGESAPPAEVERSRALMEEVPSYLRGVIDRGGLVKAGVVENVIEVRAWDQWDRWVGEIRKLGYKTRLVALNSMHAQPRTLLPAPQSRDRLYLCYWHQSLGRDPDWDKWLRPRAWCPQCGADINAIQTWKTPGRDMGRYRQQYLYTCPNGHGPVEPYALPAGAAIDWSKPGVRIGDRPALGMRELKPKTIARIEAGLRRYAHPITLEAAGHTFERRPGARTWPVDAPLTTQTTSTTKGVASVPPLVIPVEGRDGKQPTPTDQPIRTQTARNESGLAWLPFIAELRGGSSDARAITDALSTVTASGNHHALIMRNNTARGDQGQMSTPTAEPFRTFTAAGHQSLITWNHLLVPRYGNGQVPTITEPGETLTTRDQYALIAGDGAPIDINDVLFRMLEPHEIGRAMSFADHYIVGGNKREKVRQYGNAVTPNVAEILVCALFEPITGAALSRHEWG